MCTRVEVVSSTFLLLREKLWKGMVVMKPLGISGHAVMEGVLIRMETRYAVAVRKADQSIAVKKGRCFRLLELLPFLNIPFLRGIVILIGSCYLDLTTFLSSLFLFGEEEMQRKEDWEDWIRTGTGMRFTGDGKKRKRSRMEKNFYAFLKKTGMFLLMLCLLAIVLTLFLAVPVMLSGWLMGMEVSVEKKVLESGIRLLIAAVLCYCFSRSGEVTRLYQYHGAAHKAIHCIENGLELTLENAGRQPLQKKRCGTGFFFLALAASILFLAFNGTEVLWKRILFWFMLILALAAVSYEILVITENKNTFDFLYQLSFFCQNFMVKEPEEDMLEAALQAVAAVTGNTAEMPEEKETAEKETAAGTEEEKPLAAVTKERLRQALFNDEYSVRENAENMAETLLQQEQDQEEDAVLRALDKYFGE